MSNTRSWPRRLASAKAILAFCAMLAAGFGAEALWRLYPTPFPTQLLGADRSALALSVLLRDTDALGRASDSQLRDLARDLAAQIDLAARVQPPSLVAPLRPLRQLQQRLADAGTLGAPAVMRAALAQLPRDINAYATAVHALEKCLRLRHHHAWWRLSGALAALALLLLAVTRRSLFRPARATPLPHQEATAPPEETQLATQPGQLRVLVVDDVAVNRMVLEMLLRRAGHRVVGAGSGQEALSLAAEQHFDLILLDLQMPGLDGFETARRLHALPGATRGFVLAVTAHGQQVTPEKLAAAGMAEVLHKPVTLPVLQAAIARHMRV